MQANRTPCSSKLLLNAVEVIHINSVFGTILEGCWCVTLVAVDACTSLGKTTIYISCRCSMVASDACSLAFLICGLFLSNRDSFENRASIGSHFFVCDLEATQQYGGGEVHTSAMNLY